METIAADPASVFSARIVSPPTGERGGTAAVAKSPSRFVELRRGAQEVRIRPELVADFVGRDGLKIDDWLRDGMAQVVKHGRHRTVWRVELASGSIYVKHNRTPNWSDLAKNAVRGNRAARELDAIEGIAAAGIPTVEPLAVATRRIGPFPADSFLITRAIEHTISLEAVFSEPPDEGMTLTAAERHDLADQLGRLVGTMHAAGLFHGDLHAGNFLIRREADGRFNVWLIDLPTVRRLRPTLRRVARELAMFEHFFKTRTTVAERFQFLRAYRESHPIDYGQRALVESIGVKSQRWSRTVTRKADRKWLHGHRKLVIVETDSASCRGVAEIGESVLREIANDPTSTKLSAIGNVVEFTHDPKRVTWLNRSHQWSAARRVWEFSHALLRRGIPCNRPLLMLERKSITQQQQAIAFENKIHPIRPASATRQQIREAGKLLSRLHEYGFAYRGESMPFGTLADLRDLRESRQTSIDLVLTKVEEIEAKSRLNNGDIIDQLSRLNRISKPSLANRLRFLLAYLGPNRWQEWKTVWSAVQAKTHSDDAARQPTRRRFLRAAMVVGTALLGCRGPDKRVLLRPAQHSVRSGQLLVMSDRKIHGNDPAIHDLVRLRKQIAVTLGLKMSQEDVVVYIFNTEQEYRDYLDSAYPGLPSRRAYFVGTAQELAVYTYWGSRIQEDLRHEYTHGILHASLKTVPLWLDEGLAEYFEVGGARPGNPNSDYAARLTTAMQQGWQPAIERLEAIEEFKQMQHIHYQESWAWVHFLLHHSPETKQVLLSYLDDLRTTANPKPISRRLKEDLPTYNQRFAVHLRSLQQPRLLSDKNYQPPKIKRAKFETPVRETPAKSAKVSPPPFPEM